MTVVEIGRNEKEIHPYFILHKKKVVIDQKYQLVENRQNFRNLAETTTFFVLGIYMRSEP